MVETTHKMDGEFHHMLVEQDLKSGEFKRALREARAAKKQKK